MATLRGANAHFGSLMTAMVTPFDASGAIRYDRAAELAQWLLSQGNDALVINGTTGESPTTSADEKVQLVSTIVRAIGQKKVVAGAGGNNTAEVVELAVRSAEAGAGGILSVAPYYNKPSQEGLYQHFRAIAEAVAPLPVILYNVPGRTITNIEASTTARLASDCTNIIGTKEASGNMAQIGEIARLTGDDFLIYSGDDGSYLSTLALGGCGVISVISHVVSPDFAALNRAWFSGNASEATQIFLKTLPLTRAIFSAPSPAPVKHALALIGQNCGGVRLPLVDLSELEQTVVKSALTEYGLL